MINDHRIAGRVWQIQISMHVNFICSKDTGETRTIYVWSDNVSIMRGNDVDIIRDIFRSFFTHLSKGVENDSRKRFCI